MPTPTDKPETGSKRDERGDKRASSRERSQHDDRDRDRAGRSRKDDNYPARQVSRSGTGDVTKDNARYKDGPSDRYSRDRSRYDDEKRDYRRGEPRGEPARGDGRSTLPLPPPPQPGRSRQGPLGRQQQSTTSPPESSKDEESRGTPGSAPRKPAPSGVSNPMLAELLKQGKLLAKKTVGDASGPGDEDEDTEAGEIVQDAAPGSSGGAARKRKHSPILWEPASKVARGSEGAGAPVTLSLLERSQQEAMALKMMQLEQDDDYDAPAAMKSSPSASYDHDEEHDGANGNGTHTDDHEVQGAVKPKGVTSRWLTADEDDGGVVGRGGPASSPGQDMSQGISGRGGADDGTGAGTFDVDSDGDNMSSDALAEAPRFDMRKECRDVNEFEKIEKISEGTYGVVYKAREKSTGRIVALKRVKMEHETNGFPLTSVREINILLNFQHPNIVKVDEVVVSPRAPDQIYMVMEYMDHDLKTLMEDKVKFSQPFSAGQVKCLMKQLLLGVAFLHENWVLHRDLKTSNILYNGKGDLKLCDFGMARQYGEPLGTYTHLVVTLWYRAPELLFGQQQYSTAVDIWSVGCIMGEILTGKPLVPGHNEFEQIDQIVKLLGTPTPADWPGLQDLPNYKKINLKQVEPKLRQRFTAATGFGGGGTTLTEAGFDLLSKLLAWDPDKRISAKEALNHRWFSEPPLPVTQVLMPTFAPRKAG